MRQPQKPPSERTLKQFNLKTLFIWGAATQIWLLLYLFIQSSGKVEPTMAMVVLLLMTAVIYRLVRRWNGAVAWAALLAGIISLGALVVTTILISLYG